MTTPPVYPPSGMHARFDDLRTPGAPGLELVDPIGELRAWRLEDVVPVLREAVARAEAGEWVAGWVAYEAAPAFDPALSVRPASGMLAWFGRWGAAVESPLPDGSMPELVWSPEIDAEQHRRDLQTIAAHLRAGNTYQVNHTFRLRARAIADPIAAYGALARHQRGAYHAFFDAGDVSVISASPELFMEIDDGVVRAAPMKGTRRRGRDTAEDAALADELAASAKDRAEHVMIVDLLRNDIGRVAEVGSVVVDDLFDVEGYPTVWQMVSNISGRLRSDVGVVEAFGALFPCGSVTGAPKASTMRIIRDLEVSDRGIYCGAIGLLSPPGSGRPRARFSVPIRTLVVDHQRATSEFGVGGGIVFDSDPVDEWDEAWVKAKVLTGGPREVSLFETMLWEPGIGVALLDRHLDRITASAAHLGFAHDRQRLGHVVGGIAGDGPLRVRLVLAPDGEVSYTTGPIPEPLDRPVRLVLDDRPIDPHDPLLAHKVTDRTRHEAAAARFPHADDVVFWNPSGRVTETTIASIAARVDGRWLTPPLTDGLLAGVARAEALDAGWVTEGSITVADLRSAGGIRVMNALRGVRDAVLVETPA